MGNRIIGIDMLRGWGRVRCTILNHSRRSPFNPPSSVDDLGRKSMLPTRTGFRNMHGVVSITTKLSLKDVKRGGRQGTMSPMLISVSGLRQVNLHWRNGKLLGMMRRR